MGCALTLLECPDRLYSAELTWRVALLPYAIQSPAAVLLNLEHRLQWNAVLSWLGSKPLPCQITKGVNLYPLVFTAPQNGRWLLAVANLSADDAAGEAALPLLAAQGKVEHLGDDGQWGEETRLLDGRLQICVAAFSVGVWRSF
jgi:hypothetical protein